MGKRRDPRIRTAGIAASITRAQLTTLVCAGGRAGTAAGTRAVQPSRFAGSRRLPVFRMLLIRAWEGKAGVRGRGSWTTWGHACWRRPWGLRSPHPRPGPSLKSWPHVYTLMSHSEQVVYYLSVKIQELKKFTARRRIKKMAALRATRGRQ